MFPSEIHTITNMLMQKPCNVDKKINKKTGLPE